MTMQIQKENNHKVLIAVGIFFALIAIISAPQHVFAYAPMVGSQGGDGSFCGMNSSGSSVQCRAGDQCVTAASSSNNYTGDCKTGNTQGGTTTNTQSGGGSPITLPNPLGNDSDFYDLLSRFIRILTFFSAPILSALVVYAGFLYLTGGSDPGKRTTATNIIKYGIIGFVIIILANVIVAVVRGAIGA